MSDTISCCIVDYTPYFNPRSHERSDIFLFMLFPPFLYFNPRSHERSDPNSPIFFQSCLFISIHAPTRGATVLMKLIGSTLIYFNPRSHERSDYAKLMLNAFYNISIHAPTRGATAILHKKFVYFYTIPTINI